MLAVVAMAVLAASSLGAQPEPPGPGPRPTERIEQWRKIRLIEMLDLKEEQSVRFIARMNDYEKRRQEMMKEKGEVLDRLERMVRVGAPEDQFRQAFASVDSVNARLANSQREYFRGLKDVLTVDQQAKLLLFERRFDMELREAMKDLQRRRRQAGEGRPE